MIDLSTEDSLARLAELLAERVAEKVAEKLHEKAQRRFYSREEYASIHGLGIRTVDRAIAEGKLQFEKTGRRVLIPTNATITN